MKAKYNGWEIEGTAEEIRDVMGRKTVPTEERHIERRVVEVPVQVTKTHYVKKRKWKTWTKAEDEELKRLYLSGKTAKKVSRLTGRSPEAIYSRLATLGIRKVVKKGSSVRRDWVEEEDAILRKMFNETLIENMHDFDIVAAKKLGRTDRAVQQRRVKLGLMEAPSSSSSSSSQVLQPTAWLLGTADVFTFIDAQVHKDHERIIESVLKSMVKSGQKLDWNSAGYVLGINSHGKFVDWIAHIMKNSGDIAKYFGIPNKFKTNGRELWYG